MLTQKHKFSSQADPKVLEALKRIAAEEGRQFQSVLDEALRDYVERRQNGKLRKPAVDAFESSLKEFDALYRKLAE